MGCPIPSANILLADGRTKPAGALEVGDKLDTFVKTRNVFKTTGQEGYVAIDRLGGDAVKIVDRLEFSYNNFSPNVLKGWDKAGR